MMLQAYIDESASNEGAFVLAGYIASPAQWVKFTDGWERACRYKGVLNPKTNNYCFKMELMAENEEREANIPFFRHIIEDHVLLSISAYIHKNDIAAAISRIHTPGLRVEWGYVENIYLAGWRLLMDSFHERVPSLVGAGVLPPDTTFDFWFDNRVMEENKIRAAWDEYLNQRPAEFRALYGDKPRFEDDEKYLPLQAADFWAWWVRHWSERGMPEEIGKWGRWPKLHLTANEDMLVDIFMDIIAKQSPGQIICDFPSWKLP